MANEQNLTPFKPGQVAYRPGRPKGSPTKSLRYLVIRELSRIPDEAFIRMARRMKMKGSVQCIGDIITHRLLLMAANGDLEAIKELFKQTEYPLKQVIGLEGGEAGSPPIQFILPPQPTKDDNQGDPE